MVANDEDGNQKQNTIDVVSNYKDCTNDKDGLSDADIVVK